MNVFDNAKSHVRQAVEKVTHTVTEKVSDRATSAPRSQSITIARSRAEVLGLFTDAARLSVVFGDVAEVADVGPGRLRWTFVFDGSERAAWDCVVSAEGDRLRYVDVDPAKEVGMDLRLRDAPGDRGTEVTARVSAPGPGALTGALTYKALYRARALLQTGEVPTIRHNPSARTSPR